MEFTAKSLMEKLGISHVALVKSLSLIPCELKDVEGSTKPVKHYKYDDLPQRYQDKLEELGVKPKDEIKENKTNNISSANFTKKYLLAHPDKQKLAVTKCKLIDFYKKRNSTLNQKQWLEQTLKNDIGFDVLGNVSVKQLNDWIRKYKEAEDKGLNIVESFIDSRGAVKGVKALNETQKDTAERYFLRASRPRISEIYRNMCHTFGDLMPSYDALNNYFREWKRKNPVLFEFSKSPDSAKNKFLAAYGSADAKATYKNQYWELDSTPADVICEDGKRYTVLAAIDVFSRRVVFHVADTSSSYSISQLLRKAILKLGIPENVVIDNGRDYTSNHFETICTNLKINMNIVPPFSGDCKPHVERVFGTLSRELFEQIAGYIGHNVAQRSEIQSRKSFADKIKSQEKWRKEQALKTDEEKKVFRDAWKIKKENVGLDLTILESADGLQSWIDNWVDKLYEQREHKGIKAKPINKWNSDVTPVESIPDIRMLDLLLGESVIRRVNKKGISYDGCNYAHINLVEFTGHHVYIMAGQDMGYVLVYDENMNPICIAEDLEHMGKDRYAIRGAKKRSQQLMRQMDKIIKEAQAIKDVTIMDRIDAVRDVVETKTIAITKHTETVDRLLKDSIMFEEKDKKELETSNRYDFKQKDEEGLPQKILPSGRPAFNTYFDRFLWDLKNNMVDDTTKKLAAKCPDIWEMAKKEAKVG
jgi:hypothetical protein